MNDYWHIPRASLSSSSAASIASSSNRSQQSNSCRSPTTSQLRALQNLHQHQQQVKYQLKGPSSKTATQQPEMPFVGSNKSSADRTTPQEGQSRHGKRAGHAKRINNTTATATAAAAAAVLSAAKRGSRSSRGSSDSNNSTTSGASGSLLLTAANLERFAEIHNKQSLQRPLQLHNNSKLCMESLTTSTATNNDDEIDHRNAAALNSNLTPTFGHQRQEQHQQRHNDDPHTTIIPIDPNLDFIKTKDVDSVSMASSMHFTMVNGESGANRKKPKRSLCDRGRQVTVLITSMSLVFLLLIMGMVYALEMRAREMPQS